jgi:hypothetical protein
MRAFLFALETTEIFPFCCCCCCCCCCVKRLRKQAQLYLHIDAKVAWMAMTQITISQPCLWLLGALYSLLYTYSHIYSRNIYATIDISEFVYSSIYLISKTYYCEEIGELYTMCIPRLLSSVYYAVGIIELYYCICIERRDRRVFGHGRRTLAKMMMRESFDPTQTDKGFFLLSYSS